MDIYASIWCAGVFMSAIWLKISLAAIDPSGSELQPNRQICESI